MGWVRPLAGALVQHTSAQKRDAYPQNYPALTFACEIKTNIPYDFYTLFHKQDYLVKKQKRRLRFLNRQQVLFCQIKINE
jgi:hypothetical protein